MNCPLCGYTVAPGERAWACQRCPLASGCRLLRCPRCGYEWAEDSRIVTWLRARWCAWKEWLGCGHSR